MLDMKQPIRDAVRLVPIGTSLAACWLIASLSLMSTSAFTSIANGQASSAGDAAKSDTAKQDTAKAETGSTTASEPTKGSNPARSAKAVDMGEDLALGTPLEAAAYQMREHLKKMRRAAVQYHLSEAPADIARYRDDWMRMLASGRKIQKQMVQTALDELRKSGDLESQAGKFLIGASARNADADRYEGMMEVVELLAEKGHTSPQFELCYGLTASAHNRYSEAAPHLAESAKHLDKTAQEIMAEKKLKDEDKQKIAKKIFETFQLLNSLADVNGNSALWAEEQKAREDDAAGEPLPRVLIQTTKGDIEVELFENNCPNTVANFISLCERGFYDKLSFHRVLTHFMAQTGCPNGDGSGGPGYAIRSELDEQKNRNFFRGTLGMATAQIPDSGGSQFFVCYLPRTFLNDKYVAFGRVVEGMEILSDIAHVDPDDKDAEQPPFLDQILSTKVLRKRNHEYKPETIPEPKPQQAEQHQEKH